VIHNQHILLAQLMAIVGSLAALRCGCSKAALVFAILGALLPSTAGIYPILGEAQCTP